MSGRKLRAEQPKMCKSSDWIRDPRGRNFIEAFTEVLLTLLVSAAPFYLGGLALWVEHSAVYSYGESLGRINQYGELFIYAAATVAPVLYFIMKDRGHSRRIPGKALITASFWICASVAIVIFTWERVRAMELPPILLQFSVPVFALSVVTLFFAIFLDKAIPNPSATMQDEDTNYLKRYKSHRRGTGRRK